MNESDLSRQMKRLAIHLDLLRDRANITKIHVSNPPFAEAYVTIDASRQTPFPSSNPNKLHLCGCDEGDSAEFLRRAMEPFAAHGVETFFIQLSPGRNMETMRRALEELGISRFGGTGYPTLLREAGGELPAFETEFEVREVGAEEALEIALEVEETFGGTGYRQFEVTAGKEGFHHFVAFDGGRAVAIGILCVFEDMGYLMNGHTAESHRRRGAQTALIAHRVARAEALGCRHCVSETLYMLTSSLNNLQRAGFREVFAKEVYVGPTGA